MKKSLTLKVFNLLLILAVVFMNFTGAFATIASAENGENVADDLFISEYVEGSSFNKAIEIYNGTSSTVDLSDYQVALYSNGAATASQTLTLSGTLEHGEVFILAHASADDAILAKADVTNNAVINFNGDDAISLNKNNEVIDVVGEIGVRENFGVDVTLVRVPGVTSPSTIYNTNEWDAYASNTFAYLGSHTMDGVTPVDPPEEPGEPGDPGAGEYSLEEARNLPDGTIVQVEGVVTADNRAISNGAQFSTYIQDETAGINLFAYTQGNLPDVVKGDKVIVTGELATYNGLKEVVPVSVEIIAENQTLPEPKQITLEDLQNPAIAEGFEGQLVQLQGYINRVPDSLAGGGYNVSVIDEDFNGTTLRVMENALDITQVEAGYWYDLTAIVSQYNTYQLIPTEQSDIVKSEEQAAPPSSAGYYEATVATITDGDTIRIQDPVFGETRIRFLNMDTAETYTAKNKAPERAEINANQKYFGDLATDHITSLIQPGDKIYLKIGDQPTDDYGRVLAEVIRAADGMNINLQMVKDGLATSYFIAPFDEEAYPLYQEAVKTAKDQGLGIWNPENPLLELPFAFRANDDQKGFLRYVGNSDTMEYVEPNAWATVPVEKRIFFVSAEEAESYGFVPEGTVVDPEDPEEPEEPNYVVIEPKKNNGTATIHTKQLDVVNDGDHVLINIFNEKKPRDLLLNKKQVDILKDKNATLTVTDGVDKVTIEMNDVKDKVLKVSFSKKVKNK
ncbi:thermonuclease family protein [Oceanobacillus sp. CAU 1775]